ncbi:PilT/PilU family type 4a pilus ATPase [Luminiphilus sp.]|nr:PilT/PilU family type 4a pilus ATPase [Luminiphilus sp.]
MDFEDCLKTMAREGGSDLYLTTGAPPSAKFNGELRPLSSDALPPGRTKELANQLMDDQQRREFDEKLEMNLAVSLSGIGRFRVNIFKQRNEVGMVVRYIVVDIPSMNALGLASIASDLICQKRGLLLVVGATGSGKSTSLASLIDHRNSTMGGHIVTIEDPVEFIHRHKKSIVNQRELGVDTRSWDNALKNTLRQAPDVIYIGEIRDRATMEYAMSFAETGHLCVSTLHANNANQALERIINFFPEERHAQLLMDLSLNLIGVLSQRLIVSSAGARCAAVEVLLASPLVKDLILQGDIQSLKEVMEKSVDQGMKTFDQALLGLFHAGQISEEEALRNADSANNLRLKIKLANDGHVGGSGSLSLESSD